VISIAAARVRMLCPCSACRCATMQCFYHS